jgi:maltose 6'-phosphate phosphatase
LRVATFNLWNNDKTWGARKLAIIEEIVRIDPDVMALQEVPNLDELQSIADEVNLPYYTFMKYPDEEEGLAIISKAPLEIENNSNNEIINQCAQRVTVSIKGLTLGLANVHLDWKSVANREKQIIEVTKWISENSNTNYDLLCGDFNSTPDISSIYNFLIGEQSLYSYDTSWIDLGQSLQSPTLDFKNNHWLHNRDNLNSVRIPVRYDWILLKSCYPKPEPKLRQIQLFANKPSPNHHVIPSDHYGVFIDLSFEA